MKRSLRRVVHDLVHDTPTKFISMISAIGGCPAICRPTARRQRRFRNRRGRECGVRHISSVRADVTLNTRRPVGRDILAEAEDGPHHRPRLVNREVKRLGHGDWAIRRSPRARLCRFHGCRAAARRARAGLPRRLRSIIGDDRTSSSSVNWRSSITLRSFGQRGLRPSFRRCGSGRHVAEGPSRRSGPSCGTTWLDQRRAFTGAGAWRRLRPRGIELVHVRLPQP